MMTEFQTSSCTEIRLRKVQYAESRRGCVQVVLKQWGWQRLGLKILQSWAANDNMQMSNSHKTTRARWECSLTSDVTLDMQDTCLQVAYTVIVGFYGQTFLCCFIQLSCLLSCNSVPQPFRNNPSDIDDTHPNRFTERLPNAIDGDSIYIFLVRSY